MIMTESFRDPPSDPLSGRWQAPGSAAPSSGAWRNQRSNIHRDFQGPPVRGPLIASFYVLS